MLTSIREKSGSIVVKVLLVLLVISFGAWGIGDYVTGGASAGAVATVGDREISAQEFAFEYRREYIRLNEAFGGNLTPDAARQFGLPQSIVQRMVRDELLNQAAARAGIAPGDAVVLETLQGMPQFTGVTGDFDRQMFAEVIARAGYTEAGFVDLVRREVAREAYVSGLVASPAVADTLARRLYRHNEQRRDFVVAQIPQDAIPAAEVPDAEAVATYYEENKERFRAPAYRSVTLLEIGPSAVEQEISISEDEIATEYAARAGEYSDAARRNVEQIVFDDKETADKARVMLDEGRSFGLVASELTGLSAEDLQLGWVGPDDLFPEISEPVFAATTGDIVGPVESVLGWHLFLVKDAEDASVRPLSEVRDEIVADLQLSRALDRVFDLANRVDQLLGDGARLEDVGAELNLPLRRIEAVDSNGLNPDREAVDAPADPAFAGNVFADEVGVPSTLIEVEDGYYVFRVDEETPSRLLELDEIRPEVTANLMAERRIDNARKIADDLAAAGTNRAAFARAAEEMGAQIDVWEGIKRDGTGLDDPQLFQDSMSSLFSADLGKTLVLPAGTTFSVAMVTAIDTPDPSADPEGFSQVREQIAAGLSNDLSDLLVRSIADRLEASVNFDVVEREAY